MSLDHYPIDQTIILDDYAVERAAKKGEVRVYFDTSYVVLRRFRCLQLLS
jgi:hypothetical protein